MQLLVLVLAGALVLLHGCAATPEADTLDERSIQRVWPAPPEQPRFVHEFTLRSAADIADDSADAKLRRTLTGERIGDSPAFSKPSAVAAQLGRIYVSDTANHVIAVFDVPRRRVFHFGMREPGQLRKPVALAVDRRSRVYVADAARREILVYDSLGLFLSSIGGGEDLVRPAGVAVNADGSRIYVVDRGENASAEHRVIAFDGQGKRLFQIGSRGAQPGEFNAPTHASIGRDGTLYVLDAGNFRVQAFDADGAFLRAFGKVGSALGNLARPRGLAVDDQSHLFVTDGSFGNFQIFDWEGRLLLAIGRSSELDRPGRFGLLSGIAVDETGRVYVVDQLFAKVEVYRPLGDREAQELLDATSQ